MKMEKNKTKKIFAFIFLLLNIGSSLSVNTLFAQDEFEEFDFSAPLIEGSVFRSNYIDVHQTDLFKQVGDQLILLRNDTLFSLALNPDIDAPAEIISKRQIPAHSDGNPITDSEIIVTDELVIVLSGYKFEHENDAEI